MPNEFTVIGEHKEDKTQLLVVGADGEYYGYFPARELFLPIEPDDSWEMYATAEDVEADVLPTEPDTP